MDRTRDAASFTGQTLAWFEAGEEAAASERDEAAEQAAPARRLWRALAFLVVLAIAGFAAVLLARHYGLIDLPADVSLPWE
jgi:ferric-dicitrate binding protein FerR (iron transport regulator)